MTAIEICLVAAGLILMVGSFFVTEKLSPDELDKIAKLSQEEIAHIVDKEIAASHDKVQEQLETELEEVLEKLDRESDKETNEKIMAISEYSDTVIESINKSHNEIMFLYSMLGDKHKEMIDFSNEIQQRVENLQKIVTEEMVQETLYKAKEEHENQRDDVNRQAVTQHRHNLHRVIHLLALVNGAENAQRDGDAQRQNGGENVDEDRVLHRIDDDLGHVLLIELGIAEVALKQAVETGVIPNVRPETHPAHIANDQRVIKAHLRAQLLIQLFILRRLEALLLRFQFGAGRVSRNEVVQRIHQK